MEAVFPGSDALIVRSIATKLRAPNVLGLSTAGGGRALGPTDILGLQAPVYPDAFGRVASALPPAGGASASAQDPFSGATAPVARRSAQIAAPIDGEYVDGHTTARISHLLSLAGQTDKVGVPTADTLLYHAQLRREAATLVSVAKAVEAEEQELFKLERLRKQGPLAPFQPDAPPLTVLPVGSVGGAAGGAPKGPSRGGGASGRPQQQHAGSSGGDLKRALEDQEGGTASKVSRRY